MSSAKGTYPAPPAPTYTVREDGGPITAPSSLSLTRAREIAREGARVTADTGRVFSVRRSDGSLVESYMGRTSKIRTEGGKRLPPRVRAVKVRGQKTR